MSMTIANGGEIFVFDMGGAVENTDVAEKVIKTVEKCRTKM